MTRTETYSIEAIGGYWWAILDTDGLAEARAREIGEWIDWLDEEPAATDDAERIELLRGKAEDEPGVTGPFRSAREAAADVFDGRDDNEIESVRVSVDVRP